MPTRALPRSVVAALWLPHVRDLGSADRAARAVTGDDEPHVVVTGRAQLNWPALAARLVPVRAVLAALPAPGDPAGVPAAAAAAAIDAGECLLVAGARGTCAVVPEVRTFGSRLEPGATVTWSVVDLPDVGSALGADLPSTGDARAYLAEALATAIGELDLLDVARDSPGVADRLAAVTDAATWPLPRGTAPGRLDLLVRAARLLGIVSLAREDDGAAATIRDVDGRRAALALVERAARRAMSAATLHHSP